MKFVMESWFGSSDDRLAMVLSPVNNETRLDAKPGCILDISVSAPLDIIDKQANSN